MVLLHSILVLFCFLILSHVSAFHISPIARLAGLGRHPKSQCTALRSSFVNDQLRPLAVKLHTTDQAKGGLLPAQTPVVAWTPGKQDFLQFLVDGLVVYEGFEGIIAQDERLIGLRR